MLEPPGLRFIRAHVRAKRYRLTTHATTVRLERSITIPALERALLTGEIIERYPHDRPYPSCLVFGWLASGDPLHVVCSRGNIEPALRIVTLYEPEDALWGSDYKTRKVRK
ncbi:MAG TPA: hypothetical protein DCQ64_06905 [Candidatus Rokubacteria bacterium]|nr:hypothetical protein [Candidatus Rokubacteria bacterium]